MRLFGFFNPINAHYIWHFTKVFGVVCNNCQAMLTCSYGNEYIKVANNQPLTGKTMTNLCIIACPSLTDRQNRKSVLDSFRLLQVFLNSFTMKSTISKFSNAYLGSKDLLSRCLCDISVNTSTMVEVFNPRVSVKKVAFHGALFVKSYLTIKRAIVVAVYQHLIILFSFFCIRPCSRPGEKSGFPLFCREIIFLSSILFSRHDQLVSQPFTVALRKRKPLQIVP